MTVEELKALAVWEPVTDGPSRAFDELARRLTEREKELVEVNMYCLQTIFEHTILATNPYTS